MICPRCAKDNPDPAAYCSACGQQITRAELAVHTETDSWRRFIGPRADYYLKQFQNFRGASKDSFRATWHWPAFGVGWLWYLYRKMYLHAAVFLLGGFLPIALGAGLLGVVLWNVFAAVAANFLYYMHIKFNLALIEKKAAGDLVLRERLVTEAGGIQPYVWWLGFALMALAIGAGLIQAPSPTK